MACDGIAIFSEEIKSYKAYLVLKEEIIFISKLNIKAENLTVKSLSLL